MAAQHRVGTTTPTVAAWLGAGAITLGIGAALTSGTAVANASTDDSGATTNSAGTTHRDSSQADATSSTDCTAGHKSTTSSATQTHPDGASPAPKKNPHRRAEVKDASDSSRTPKNVTTEDSTSSDSTATPATTHGHTVVSRRSKSSTRDDNSAVPATAAVQATVSAATAAPKVTAVTAAKAATAPANPLVALNQAVQSFLHSIQVQYFNTPPKITGHTAPVENADGTYSGHVTVVDKDGDPLAYSAPVTAKPAAPVAAAISNPLTTLVYGIEGWINKTFNSTVPSVTVSSPTKNTDGTYTGQITASDIDGDPLSLAYYTTQDGTTTLADHDDGTYTYTYTPSESATTTPNSKYSIYVVATETNAASHFHGPVQIQDAIMQATLGNLLRALDPSYSRVLPPYAPSNWARGSTSVSVPVGPVVPRTTA